MAVAYRGVGTAVAQASGTSLANVPAPAEAVAGDFLIACIIDKSTASTNTAAPTGWTALCAAGGTNGRMQLFTATMAAATSWTWTGLTDNDGYGRIVAYSGAVGVDVAASTAYAANNISVSGIVTTKDNTVVLAFLAGVSGASSISSAACASGPTLAERFDATGAGGEAYVTLALADGTKETAGATGTLTASVTGNGSGVGALVALRALMTQTCTTVTGTGSASLTRKVKKPLPVVVGTGSASLVTRFIGWWTRTVGSGSWTVRSISSGSWTKRSPAAGSWTER